MNNLKETHSYFTYRRWQGNPNRHLFTVRPMILAVPELTKSLTAFSLKVDGGCVEKNKFQSGKKVSMLPEQSFFNQVLCTSGSKRYRSSLVTQYLAQISHGPIRMMLSDILDSGNRAVSSPLVAGPVGPRYEEPMQDSKENNTFHIEFKLPVRKQAMDNRRHSKFLPESLEDQRRTNFDGMGCNIDLAGKDKQGLLRESGKRAGKGFDASLGLELVETTDSRNDSLADFTADPVVFDKLIVKFRAGLTIGKNIQKIIFPSV